MKEKEIVLVISLDAVDGLARSLCLYLVTGLLHLVFFFMEHNSCNNLSFQPALQNSSQNTPFLSLTSTPSIYLTSLPFLTFPFPCLNLSPLLFFPFLYPPIITSSSPLCSSSFLSFPLPQLLSSYFISFLLPHFLSSLPI